MIHLDSNLYIDLVTIGSPHTAVVRQWLQDGEGLAVCAIAWSEFLNAPHTKQQKDAVNAIVGRRVLDFTAKEAAQRYAKCEQLREVRAAWLAVTAG